MVIMRRRPMLRAAAVGGGAYLAGKHAARRRADQQSQDAVRDERISNLEQQASAPAPAQAPAAGPQETPSMTDQLGKLAELHREGLLNDDEFAAAKSKLLGG
jgi:hypothetical protein